MTMLREDVTDPTSVQDVPEEFKTEVRNVLFNELIDFRIFDQNPDLLERIYRQVYEQPLVAEQWNSPDRPLNLQLGVNNVAPVIRAVLFQTKTNSNLLELGLGLKEQSGQTLSAAEQRALSGGAGTVSEQRALQQQVIQPFANFGVSGNDYGQEVDPNSPSGAYGPIHLGVDYGTPENTPIYSPFAGTVHVEMGVPGYGNLVYVTLADGQQIRFGHVAGPADGIVDGMAVNPGDQIATSGANVGNAQGAVTLVEWKDKNGNLVNPHQYLDPIWAGTTYQKLGFTNAQMGDGITRQDAELRKFGITDKTLGTVYSGANGLWKQYYGREPTTAQLHDLISHGSDPTSWEDYIRAQPAHVPGLNMGQYTDFRSLLDKTSQSLLGHNSTDGIVKDLWHAQITDPKAVTNWYNEHSPNEIGATEQK